MFLVPDLNELNKFSGNKKIEEKNRKENRARLQNTLKKISTKKDQFANYQTIENYNTSKLSINSQCKVKLKK